MVKLSLKAALAVATLFLGATLVINLQPSAAFAQGDEHHHQQEMSVHMQAMMSVKGQIPEEYAIMDRTPVTPTEKSLDEAKGLFLQNCAVCHGEKGDGKGPAAIGMKTKPANFLDLGHSGMYGPGDKFWIIGQGLKNMGMPGFEGNLSPRERWNLVNYIYHLQKRDDLESLFHVGDKHSH